jgi:hypothetical protein
MILSEKSATFRDHALCRFANGTRRGRGRRGGKLGENRLQTAGRGGASAHERWKGSHCRVSRFAPVGPPKEDQSGRNPAPNPAPSL